MNIQYACVCVSVYVCVFVYVYVCVWVCVVCVGGRGVCEHLYFIYNFILL